MCESDVIPYRYHLKSTNIEIKCNKIVMILLLFSKKILTSDILYTNRDLITLVNELKINYSSIAVITKTQDSADKIYNASKDKIEINLINKDNLDYYNNINILPSFLSKGLEFDAVIVINDFSSSISDLKLLYVSMTRALHKLIIKEDVC